jgi:predicted RNA-binding Zn ribbon-like protein
MNSDTFDLEAGALCLDYANTLENRAGNHPQDLLNDYFDLLRWGEAAGILHTEQAKQLRQIAEHQPEGATAVYENAIQLRETLYRIFANFWEQGSASPDDLAILNDALSSALPHLQVIPSSPGFTWDWTKSPDNLEQILWPVARSAGELLVSDLLDRVRQCADDRGCSYLFVDTSRNRSRRWCSMESCGNRAKARRHYKRQRKDQ